MPTDINKLKEKLALLQNQTKKEDVIWKPKSGKTVIRIVPYKYSEDNFPFIELLFHYKIGGKTYLSPKSFGERDPLIEFAEKLKASGDKENFALAKKLEPKSRTYAPIVIRGEEEQGTKFWGFGKTVYQDLLNVMVDEDYGDITDTKKGRDIVVTFMTAEEAGKSFPETKIVIKPAESPLTTNPDIAKKIVDSQKRITDIYKLLSYEELQDVLKKWLEGESDSESTEGNDTYVEEESVPQPNKKPTPKTSTPATKTAASTPDEIAAQFDDLFKKS